MRQSFLVRAGALVLSGTMAACGSRVAVDTSKDDSATTMASGSSSGGGGVGGIGPNGAEGGGGNSTTMTIYDLPPAQDEGMAIVQKLCPTIAAEKHLCVGLRPGTAWHTVALSPDTGAVCVMGEIETPLYGTNQTIAVVGEYLYGCDWNVWRVALTGGPQEPLDIPPWCDQIVANGDHFLVSPKLSSATLYHYASFDDLAADTPLETLTLDAAGSAFAIQEETLWSCEESPKEVWSYVLPSATPTGTVPLPGEVALTTVRGLDASSDGLLFLLTLDGLFTLDTTSGTVQSHVDLSAQTPTAQYTSGLHCWTNP